MINQTTPPQRESLPRMIIGGMPPIVRAVFFSVLALPLLLSVSAILLQVNLGSILTKIIDNKLDLQTQEMQAEYVRQMTEIRAALEDALTQQDLAPLARQVDGVEERLTAAERTLARVAEYLFVGAVLTLGASSVAVAAGYFGHCLEKYSAIFSYTSGLVRDSNTVSSISRAFCRTDRGTQSIDRSSSKIAPRIRVTAYVLNFTCFSGSYFSIASKSPNTP